jgi:hypothetical protein
MSEATAHPPDTRLVSLEELARILPYRLPRVPDESYPVALARAIDRVLVNVSRGRGAVDISIGEYLDALGTGGRVLRLGYVSVGDYARERLGIPASTAQKMARFARRLRDRPLLREAVRSGEVSIRKAEAVMPLARGEAEELWVARARRLTVRALVAAVKKAGAGDVDNDEEWERFCADVPAARRAPLDEALDVAGKILGANAPKWERLRALCEEYVGGHDHAAGAPDPIAVSPSRAG